MIFAKNFARNYEKKIILGISATWAMSRWSQGLLYGRLLDFAFESMTKSCLSKFHLDKLIPEAYLAYLSYESDLSALNCEMQSL